jgi:pyruvate dehydrogenase E1 component
VVAATEYVRGVADQVRAFVPGGRSFTALGADGYGRSDTREHLRHFFEVDRYWIAHAALAALARDGKVNAKDVSRAIRDYKIDPQAPNPLTV